MDGLIKVLVDLDHDTERTRNGLATRRRQAMPGTNCGCPANVGERKDWHPARGRFSVTYLSSSGHRSPRHRSGDQCVRATRRGQFCRVRHTCASCPTIIPRPRKWRSPGRAAEMVALPRPAAPQTNRHGHELDRAELDPSHPDVGGQLGTPVRECSGPRLPCLLPDPRSYEATAAGISAGSNRGRHLPAPVPHR